MTQILSSYVVIDRLVRQTFGVEPDVMATLAHRDTEVQLRRLPDATPSSDPHDGVEVFMRRVVATSVAMRHHRGAVTLYTDQQARAAGWPSARLANMAIVLSWALYISQGETLSVPLLLEADEDVDDYADVLLGIDAKLPAFGVLRHELYGNCSVVTDPVEQIDETHMAAPICRGRHLVRLDALAAEWFGIDTATITLPSDRHGPKMKSNSQGPPMLPSSRGWIEELGRFHPDRSWMRAAAGIVRVCRMSSPCLRAVESTERRMAKVSAPAQVRKPPEIFIFTFIMRMSCSA